MNSKFKKIAIGSCALALMGAISVGGTIAYLTKTTEQRANNFTFSSKALDARLTEPEWDGVIDYVPDPEDPTKLLPVYDYDDDDDPVYGYEDGDRQKPIKDPKDIDRKKDYRPRKDSKDDSYKPEYGDKQAQNMVPGQEAKKNPLITNTGKYDEWVGIKITFVYADGSEKEGQPLGAADYMLVRDVIEIDYAADKANDELSRLWVRPDKTAADISQVFYYTKVLEVGQKTEPIFTTVKVKPTATDEQINNLITMGGFAIWVEGYAVQKEQYLNEAGEPDSAQWIGSYIGTEFTHTPTSDSNLDIAAPGIFPGD